MSWDEITHEIAELKKKSIAIKPLRVGLSRLCPECARRVWQKYNYCPGCGQRLKWSNEK